MSFKQLQKLGFDVHRIMETVVTTLNKDGSVNAAPMGVMLQRKDEPFLIRPYVNTRTFRNLIERREAVINITSDPEIFFKTTFKEVLPAKRIPASWISSSKTLQVGRLKKVNSWVEVIAKNHVIVKDRASISCKPLAIVSGDNVTRAYSRAGSLVIESIIHATRVKLFNRRGEKDRVRVLLSLINNYADVVRRVAANSIEDRTMKALKKLILSWNVDVDSTLSWKGLVPID